MTSKEIRKAFLDFFESKKHKIVPSAPMVVKNDPTLMFTNAGMNQFKDIFLELRQPDAKRIADSQKCLRVSGKHNDLEEVGKDTYHHTMFEMLGNWSFGDYFKKEAIEWGWEFLTDVMKLDKNRLYATVFEGAADDNLEKDTEAEKYWEKYLPKERILEGNKKDNFWEMGETGPCGPCSEIHIDLRPDKERKKISGRDLVNKDHPLVIEIWNLVFIQFNRKQNGSLEQLPKKHVDTGMGFERLCMAVLGKYSNYDTDVFQPIISKISEFSGFKYGKDKEIDIAMRVIADHIRTISFSIADGQLPSNEKAGYVIRRILRRAVRYAFTFLDQKSPFLFKLIPTLIEVMGEQYSEISKQKELIMKVTEEEEFSFLKTLDTGIRLLDNAIEILNAEKETVLDGKLAFTLYDSFGFPPDLTQLILSEKGYEMDKKGFDEHMKVQKDRSRNVVKQETDEWINVYEDDVEEFVGYDRTEAKVKISRYRKAKVKGKEEFHLVFNLTPFYAESGGQVGDTGFIESNEEKVEIIDTQKEHNQIIHITKKLPKNIETEFHAVVNSKKQKFTASNHSATHLLHYALRKVLGTHVEQKGSLVDEKKLRFDFAHYQKVSNEEIKQIEVIVNNLIRLNIPLNEFRNIPIDEAREMGAMALFGEKYGDTVRVIRFGESVELCGGIHVNSTGEIGMIKIISEGAISAGIRRIEAITAVEVEKYLADLENTVDNIKDILKTPAKIEEKVEKLVEENKTLRKQVEEMQKEKIKFIKLDLKANIKEINGLNVITAKLDAPNADFLKQISYELKGEVSNMFLALGTELNGKALLSVMLGNELLEKGMNANTIIREASKEIQGGGGGQPFYATAGGKNPAGLDAALKKCVKLIAN
ncbi:MAG: alanine--tRNA ligase [Bacteroidales bacterium]|nr:alanine--tRNA ligase [Bacteroidales bacterium]